MNGAVPPETFVFTEPLFSLHEVLLANPPINNGGFTVTVVVAVASQPAAEVEVTEIVYTPGVFIVYTTF